jgi:hypothetical protein
MADSWQGLMYVRDNCIKLGGVTRTADVGDWQALRYTTEGLRPLGDYPSLEAAQRAVEKAWT